ncbi:MAG: hypothetical protein RIR35_7 [Actinomycetota bacterium]
MRNTPGISSLSITTLEPSGISSSTLENHLTTKTSPSLKVGSMEFPETLTKRYGQFDPNAPKILTAGSLALIVANHEVTK